MKTKDFIKMLHEADPEGEGYIRFGAGAPYFAYTCPGYWDGPFKYLEELEDGTKGIVVSTKGYKVEIREKCLDDLVCDYNGDLEEIYKRVRFDLTYCDPSSRIQMYKDYIEEEAREVRNLYDK